MRVFILGLMLEDKHVSRMQHPQGQSAFLSGQEAQRNFGLFKITQNPPDYFFSIQK